MINFLKQFLKPNWWKMGTWLSVAMISLTAGRTFYPGRSIGYSSLGVQRDIVPHHKHNPFLFPFAGERFDYLPYPAESINDWLYIAALLIYIYIYWYLLACLIYFVASNAIAMFAKIRKIGIVKKDNNQVAGQA